LEKNAMTWILPTSPVSLRPVAAYVIEQVEERRDEDIAALLYDSARMWAPYGQSTPGFPTMSPDPAGISTQNASSGSHFLAPGLAAHVSAATTVHPIDLADVEAVDEDWPFVLRTGTIVSLAEIPFRLGELPRHVPSLRFDDVDVDEVDA
jgi:hypothetical protein